MADISGYKAIRRKTPVVDAELDLVEGWVGGCFVLSAFVSS